MEKEENTLYQIYSLPIGDILIKSDGEAIIQISQCRKENKIQRGDSLLDRAAEQIEEYLKGKREVFELPLSPRGTEFQRKVWSELCKVSYGETASYKQIAERIDKKTAYRAVGMACKKNPIWIVIPCHRIIGANGDLTGYAGGIEMKQKLLELEKIYYKNLNPSSIQGQNLSI